MRSGCERLGTFAGRIVALKPRDFLRRRSQHHQFEWRKRTTTARTELAVDPPAIQRLAIAGDLVGARCHSDREHCAGSPFERAVSAATVTPSVERDHRN